MSQVIDEKNTNPETPFILKDYMSDEYVPKANESMFIQASAGTGKTFTITGIVETLVKKRGLHLNEILIVTYTEKAVGELRDRIRKSISKIENNTEDVDNAPIFTIHSFCQKTLSDFAFTAKQPENLSLADDSSLGDFIDRWIRDKLTQNTAEGAEFKELFENKEQEKFINSFKKDMLACLPKYYLNIQGEEVQSIVSLDTSYKTTEHKNIPGGKVSDFRDYLNYIAYENSQDKIEQTIYKAVFSTPGSGTNKTKTTDFKEWLFYRKQVKEIYQAWQAEKEANRLQSYDDMLRNIREAVCTPDSPLLTQLRNKYKYAIIDEFQDTNQKQWDTFKKIFLEDKEHTIIVVGDPKQSIYSFEGADVNVYNKAKEDILANGGSGYNLLYNYRSTDDMIEACNKLFEQREKKDGVLPFFDPDSEIKFADSKAPEDEAEKKLPPLYDGKRTPPLWIAGNEENRVSPGSFATIAVQQIIDCMTLKDGKTKLQIFDENAPKENKKLRNVSFHDFAILCRSKGEIGEFEAALQQSGIPYLRYKDKNLFSGIECSNWISLFNAIAAQDFTGRRRALLNEALYTAFFDIPLEEIDSQKYDNPYCEERQKIIQWQLLAQRREWAKLLEKIFEDTDIENRLSGIDQLPSLSKYRQIGNYAVEYLYKNNCSIEELSKSLSRAAAGSIEGGEDSNIVAKGTDFDCVQIMTIHASKGLGFPVVICPGGYKGLSDNIAQAFLYHKKDANGENSQAILNFTTEAKNKMRIEDDYERQRIYYVAYTRASSLMILPFYDKWDPACSTKAISANHLHPFLNYSFIHIFNSKNTEGKQFFRPIQDGRKNFSQLQEEVKQILSQTNSDKEIESIEQAEENAQAQMQESKKLVKNLPELIIKKHSYSTLSHGKTDTLFTENGGRINKEGDSQNEDTLSTAEFDLSGNHVSTSYDKDLLPLAAPENFPKGTKLGIALHEIFEKTDFVKTGGLSSMEEAAENENLKQLITDCFTRQTFIIDEKDSNRWRAYMAGLVWNVLNANFPEVTGSNSAGKLFSLKEISLENRISEAEFNFNPDNKDVGSLLKYFCNGFIDLVFMRKIDGREVYSLLDWKSDSFEAEQYSNPAFIKNHTDKKYSIQRVLYSYALVKWLSIFFEKTPEEIFNMHFGGMYYVYVRGCKAGSSNGIYAHSWKNWDALNTAFTKLCDTLIRNK